MPYRLLVSFVLAVVAGCGGPPGTEPPGDGAGADVDGASASDGGGIVDGPLGDGGSGAAWHPSYLALGTLYEGDSGADSFFTRVRPRFPSGRGLDYGYLYLNGGAQIGEWGDRVRRLVGGARRNNMKPVFVVYAMNGDSDSADAVFTNMQSAAYLTTYFRALRDAVRAADSAAGTTLVGYVIEPDMLGYLQQQVAPGYGNDPTRIPAATRAAYDAGVLTRGVDPDFGDNLTGLVQAISYTIRKHGGEVFLGWQLNLWGAPGAPNSGIVHATEVWGREMGLARIRDNARALAGFARRAGVGAGTDLISIDKYGLDGGGAPGTNPSDPATSYWFWNADLWNNYLLFVRTLREELGQPIVLWQIPVGRINTTAHASPTELNPSGRFADLDNTFQRYEDSASTFFFGDTFTTSGARLSYFRRNDSGDPKVSATGSAVTWGSHLPETAAAGAVVILFGAGVGAATRGVPQPSGPLTDQPTDGYYWIVRAAEYYGSPVPLP